MRKVDDGKKEKREKKRMAFLVATTSLPAVYRPNGYARTTIAGTPHARANNTENHRLEQTDMKLLRVSYLQGLSRSWENEDIQSFHIGEGEFAVSTANKNIVIHSR